MGSGMMVLPDVAGSSADDKLLKFVQFCELKLLGARVDLVTSVGPGPFSKLGYRPLLTCPRFLMPVSGAD